MQREQNKKNGEEEEEIRKEKEWNGMEKQGKRSNEIQRRGKWIITITTMIISERQRRRTKGKNQLILGNFERKPVKDSNENLRSKSSSPALNFSEFF